MASLSDFYIKKETLEQMLHTMNSRGMKGVNITVAIEDEANQFGKNVSAYVSQTKEEKDSKKKRFYIGSGNTFWTNGIIKQVTYSKETGSSGTTTYAQVVEDDDDIPF